MFQYLKPSFVLAIAACSLWSCNNEEGKSRYFSVKLDGEESWSILDTKSGEVLCKNDFKSGVASCDSSIVGGGSAREYFIDCGKLRTWTADVLHSFLWYLYSGKAALESDLAACPHRRFLHFGILRCWMVYHYAGRCKRETDGLCQSINFV